MVDYHHQLVFITGGSSGIGLELAKLMGSLGANICILARRPEQLEVAKAEIEKVCLSGSRIDTLSADVTDPAQIKTVIGKYIENAGVPDILINSAGVVFPGEFHQQDPDLFKKTIAINFFGSVNIIWSILPGMTARGSGKIINIGSLLSYVGLYGYTAYCASKYALRGFSDALRTEMQSQGIQVHLVIPTDTQTPQLEFEKKHKPELVKTLFKILGVSPAMGADTVANAILNGVEKGRYIILPGLDSKLMYFAANHLGQLTYPTMDFFMTQAAKKTKGNK